MIASRTVNWAVAAFAAAAFLVSTAWADKRIADVPVPDDIAPLAMKDTPWGGIWAGAWGESMRHVMAVEKVDDSGAVSIVYAIAGFGRIQPQWHRLKGKLTENGFTAQGQGFSATYRRQDDGTLRAWFVGGPFRALAVMKPYKASDVLKSSTSITWSVGQPEMLETDLQENGEPVRLKSILYRPKGQGPFPLAVLNHGSTGSGRDPGIAKAPWSDIVLATYLTDRGFLVAFPQRRGRGGSDGLYDEGFARNRAEGYACNPKRSLPGAERAMTDLNAAIKVLQMRADVASGPVLLGGVSRGGILSAAYAGAHPDQVSGVINFVGGWMGSACRNARYINQTLFKQAAAFKKPIIWLYGRKDPFYPITHSEGNFAAFRDAGGQGSFHAWDTPSGNGHILHLYQSLWDKPLSAYLNGIKPAQ